MLFLFGLDLRNTLKYLQSEDGKLYLHFKDYKNVSIHFGHILLPYRATGENVLFKASGAEAFRLYELNLLAFVLNKFDFWGPKCPNYLNIEF